MQELGSSINDTSAATLTVLLVEDSLTQREATRTFLESCEELRLSVLEASTAKEGLELLKACRVECILLDFQLPDMNGLEFMDALFTIELGFRPPIVVVTGQGSEQIAVQALKNGADDYVVKGPHAEHFELLPFIIQKVYQERLMAYEKDQLNTLLWEHQHSKDLLLEATGDGVIGLDQEGRILFLNPVAGQLLHQDPSASVGMDIDRLFSKAGGSNAVEILRVSAKTGNKCQGEILIHPEHLGGSQDIEKMLLDYVVLPIKDKNDGVKSTLVLLREANR